MIFNNVQRMAMVRTGNIYSQAFTVAQDAPVGYPISVRVWRVKPPVRSWQIDDTLTDIGARQSVAFDGVHLYVTSQNEAREDTNTYLVKRLEDGTFVQERDCAADGGGILVQINGIFYNSLDGLLYVSCPAPEGQPDDWIHVYDPTDLSYITKYKCGDYISESAVFWHGSWWIGYHMQDVNWIDRYDANWVFQKQYILPHPLPATQDTSGNINGLMILGDILYANWHEITGSKDHQLTNAYVLANDELLNVGSIEMCTEKTGQGFNYYDQNGKVYWAERIGGGVGPYNIRITTPIYEPGELYCDGKCRPDFQDLRVVDPATGKTLCGEGTGWMEYVVGPSHDGNSAFCWLHFTLQDAHTGPKAFQLEFGDANKTWSDDRASVVEQWDDFEDGTRGNFTLDYNTVISAESSTEDFLQGTRSLKWKAPSGAVYCPEDTYTAGMQYRIIGWMRRDPTEDANPNNFMEGSDGQRSSIQNTIGSFTSYDPVDVAWNYLINTTGDSAYGGNKDWFRTEIRNDKTNRQNYVAAWVGDGSSRLHTTAKGWFPTQTLDPTYKDLTLYGSGFADSIFRLPLVIPEPVVSDVQSVEVQGMARTATVDMDGDGIPDTVVHYTGNMVVTENGNSVNVDLDGDGVADIVLPK